MKQFFNITKKSPINNNATMNSKDMSCAGLKDTIVKRTIVTHTIMRRTIVRLYMAVAVMMIMFVASAPAMAASGIGSISKTSFTENKNLVYDRLTNPYIGITPDESTKGSSFQVTNENGKTVFSGKIASSKTFYIPTGKLGVGYFSFYINGFMVQQFFVC